MDFKKRFYYTGSEEKKFLCQLTFYRNKEGEDIFSFLSEYSGDRLEIKKVNNVWIYHGGTWHYSESWIEELGNQIDSGEYK